MEEQLNKPAEEPKKKFTPIVKGLIWGLILSAITLVIFVITIGASAYYLNYPLIQLGGIDYILMILQHLSLWSTLLVSFPIIILICVFIGFLYDKRFSLKTKIAVTVIIVLLLMPGTIYSFMLKQGDKELIQQLKTYELQGGNLDVSICDKFSVFQDNGEHKPEKIECISLIAKKTNNPQLCELIKEPWAYAVPGADDKKSCYYGIAVQNTTEQ